MNAEKQGYMTLTQAIERIGTSRTNFLYHCKKLNIKSKKFLNDKNHYIRVEDVNRVRERIVERHPDTELPEQKVA
jgi:hypothetical protein